jgi:aspartate ammonia-lyase
MMRTEKDFLGEKQLPENALYGIHSLRAKENFPLESAFPIEWYKAVGLVKQAYYQTYLKFSASARAKYPNPPIQLIDDEIIDFLEKAAAEVASGKHFDSFIVPGISGGAGTSINMNVNEIIANRALILAGKSPGNYAFIDPIEHANVFQSTNDTIPSALRVAVLFLLKELEKLVNELRLEIEKKEQEYRNTLRIAYTQMQEAVPSSFGRLFSTYNDALSRDWWRISKCQERLKQLNLGGGAVGTGMAVPRYFIMEVVQQLQHIIHLPVARAENLSDATTNLDSLVEVHGIIKSHAVNLEKMVNDLRLLASDLHGSVVSLPQKQAGSSIMPGKVNPVIAEFTLSVCHSVYANDQIVTNLSAQGCLDLNAYTPVIGKAMIESLKALIAANQTIRLNMIAGLSINNENSVRRLFMSPAITTALIPLIGYNKASEMAAYMKQNQCTVFMANEVLGFLEAEKLQQLLSPANLLREGYSLSELE